MNVTNLQAVLLSACLAVIGTGLSAMNLNIPGLILLVLGLLGIISVLGFNIYRSKADVFPSSLIPWLFLRVKKNNPNLFPDLNELTLKKHIALASSHCPFEKDIKHIYLFEGTPFRYQLVVVGKDNRRVDGIRKYWDRSPSDIFEDHFNEVYKKDPAGWYYWKDWNVIAVSSLNEIPNEIVLKRFKWVLY